MPVGQAHVYWDNVVHWLGRHRLPHPLSWAHGYWNWSFVLENIVNVCECHVCVSCVCVCVMCVCVMCVCHVCVHVCMKYAKTYTMTCYVVKASKYTLLIAICAQTQLTGQWAGQQK